MFAKDLTGCLSHCCVEGGDHWIYVCIFVAHGGDEQRRYRIVYNVQLKLPSTVQWTKWQCLPLGVTFLWLLFQFLCFVTWFWVLDPKQIRTFHTSQKVSWFFVLGWFFSITSQTFVKAVLCDSSRSSCPHLFSSFALNHWVGLLWYCLRSCCENLLHMQNNQNFGSSVRASRPFYFLHFQALTYKHCSSFGCPNSFLFDLPWFLFITEDTVRFQNHFLKNYGKMPRSSRLLNFLWIFCERFQVIDIFGRVLLSASMITMFWFQFLRHLVEWIFNSIWWVGRFYRSPFADILKHFQSILRSLATRNV